MPDINDFIDNIKKIALKNIEYEADSFENAVLCLKRWWCRHYDRPFKDPVLETYSLEELLLEFFEITLFDKKQRLKAKGIETTGDIEDALGDQQEFDNWVKEEEKKASQRKPTQAELLSTLKKGNPNG